MMGCRTTIRLLQVLCEAGNPGIIDMKPILDAMSGIHIATRCAGMLDLEVSVSPGLGINVEICLDHIIYGVGCISSADHYWLPSTVNLFDSKLYPPKMDKT